MKHNIVTKKHNERNKDVASENKELLQSSQCCTWISCSFTAFVACDAGLAVFQTHGFATCLATPSNLPIFECWTQEAPFSLLQGDPGLHST